MKRACWICGRQIEVHQQVTVSYGTGHPHFLQSRAYHESCFNNQGGEDLMLASTPPHLQERGE
jgi:hypothetical protein